MRSHRRTPETAAYLRLKTPSNQRWNADGEPGHEGTTRKMVAAPDEIENISSQFCTACGRNQSEVEGILDYVIQEIDLPQIHKEQSPLDVFLALV